MTNATDHARPKRRTQVFLDVGANTGQSLAAAQEWGFDVIHSFEPAAPCWPYLDKLANQRTTTIHRFGLWDRDVKAGLLDPGSKGASMWQKIKRIDNGTKPVLCDFKRASTWFRDNLTAPATVFLKLNCEGAECDILDDLLDSGEFEKVTHLMVDFDVRKIPEMKHREQEMLARLAAYPAPRVYVSRVAMVGDTHKARTHNWLRLCTKQAPPAS